MEHLSENFMDAFLQLHNKYRAIHGAPPLQIDEKLNDYAQEWADELASKDTPSYRPEAEYGENVYISIWGKSKDGKIKPAEPLESWYREGRYFRYGEEQPRTVEHVRHFTQMIWMESTTLGIGIASNSDGRVYFVCNYNPRGNVEGQFAKNVLPLQQEDQELLPDEAEVIRYKEPRPEVVKSMERIYAVPSEKLRVWMIWLTKVSEIADEWQKWLRAHIDFTLRLADRLCEIELDIKPAEAEEVVSTEEVPPESEVGDSTREERESSVYEDARETLTSESADKPADGESISSEPQEEQVPSEATLTAGSEATLTAASEATLTAGAEPTSKVTTVTIETVDVTLTWPIGIPWEQLGPKEPDYEQEFEPLPLPTNAQEMKEFLKQFMHQATIYRSYYKHWRETADEATKHIGGRLVLATFIVQGKDHCGRFKKPVPRPLRSATKISRKGRAASIKKASVVLEDKKVEAPEEAAASIQEAPEEVAESIEEAPEESAASIEEAPEESAASIPKAADDEDAATTRTSKPVVPSTVSIKGRSRTKLSSITKRSLKIAEWVRECARAVEPIPYIFYLRAEPDIDIAIEHDDEEVILADLDRENVVGNRKRLFFNLADKPCKGGKPYL